MLTDLDTLITALYVEIDDRLPRTRRMGRPPKLSDAELVTLAVAQALLGITSESRWLPSPPPAWPMPSPTSRASPPTTAAYAPPNP